MMTVNINDNPRKNDISVVQVFAITADKKLNMQRVQNSFMGKMFVDIKPTAKTCRD